MPTMVTKRFRFDAAHRLPDHDGKCRNLHGHTYTAEVTVTGPILHMAGQSDNGMVMDFGVLTDAWEEGLEPHLDHQYLNDSIGGAYDPPTAENVAMFIFESLLEGFEGLSVRLISVRLYETPDAWAEVS